MRAIATERWKQIDAIFDAALDLPPEDREAFLRTACQDDPELYGKVRSLLDNSGDAAALLGDSVSDFAEPLLGELQAEIAREEWDSLPADRRIGPYRIVREIGRGGMGAVYLAERADGEFEQRVALKLV